MNLHLSALKDHLSALATEFMNTVKLGADGAALEALAAKAPELLGQIGTAAEMVTTAISLLDVGVKEFEALLATAKAAVPATPPTPAPAPVTPSEPTAPAAPAANPPAAS